MGLTRTFVSLSVLAVALSAGVALVQPQGPVAVLRDASSFEEARANLTHSATVALEEAREALAAAVPWAALSHLWQHGLQAASGAWAQCAHSQLWQAASWAHAAWLAAALFVLLVAFPFFCMPYVVHKDLVQGGQYFNNALKKTAADGRVRKHKNGLRPGASDALRMANVPPPFPNGWFHALDSDELKVGDVKSVDILGLHLVAFRGEDGKVTVLDAFCPHLGANLAVGGVVNGNRIECPFHGWQFGHDGKCEKIPYCEKVPDVAKTKAYHVREVGGYVWLWHHADNEEPWNFDDTIPEVVRGSMYWHGKTEHYVGAHIQEIPENGADVAHLNVLHAPSSIPLVPIFNHSWAAYWKPGPREEGRGHVTDMLVQQWFTFAGRRLWRTDVEIHQFGPGIVSFRFHTPFGCVLAAQTVTPVKPLLQRVCHFVWAERWVPRIVAKTVVYFIARQFERDVPIWNNKIYTAKPLLVTNDGAIGQFRRWFAQFYSSSSVTIEQARQTLDW